MKYTLVLGIAYKKYKYPGYKMSPGNIAVYVGGRLIDAFQIDQDVTFVDKDTLPSLLDETYRNRIMSFLEHSPELVPKFFKIYKIEEQDLKGLVEIKVDNSHSDHNNGFMNKSSMIKFPIIGLFPSHFVENKGQQLMRIIQKIAVGRQKQIKRSGDPDDDFRADMSHAWPCAENFFIKPQNNMYEKDRTSNTFWWVGGNFTAEIPIKTKHRIKYLSSIGAKEIGFIGRSVESLILATCKPLLNIYDEDQRNNHT